MIKLKDILSEILNTFQIEAILVNDSKFSISDILNQIRGLRKITIVNIEPIDIEKPNLEYHKIKIKFVTRNEPKKDLEQFKNDILSSDLSKTDLRIPGVKSIKFKEETLKRL
tara:strand:+ start:543 stop:878 length:336 start_codon:yes stop_codon:yes gene_type:complete